MNQSYVFWIGKSSVVQMDAKKVAVHSYSHSNTEWRLSTRPPPNSQNLSTYVLVA